MQMKAQKQHFFLRTMTLIKNLSRAFYAPSLFLLWHQYKVVCQRPLTNLPWFSMPKSPFLTSLFTKKNWDKFKIPNKLDDFVIFKCHLIWAFLSPPFSPPWSWWSWPSSSWSTSDFNIIINIIRFFIIIGKGILSTRRFFLRHSKCRSFSNQIIVLLLFLHQDWHCFSSSSSSCS